MSKSDIKEKAYDWLKNYHDWHGRTWRDLSNSQIHHANSPCFQAFKKTFPDLKDPKFYLKQALARLKREENHE